MPSKRGPRIVVRVSCADHPKNGLDELVRGHHINHAVSVTLPAAGAAAAWARHSNLDDAIFSVLELPLAALVQAHIAQLDGRTPPQTAVASLGRRIDGQGAASSTHGGDLVLDVDAETFQVLGLQGQRVARPAGGALRRPRGAGPRLQRLPSQSGDAPAAAPSRPPAVHPPHPHVLWQLQARKHPL
jgi:hypothetical protein